MRRYFGVVCLVVSLILQFGCGNNDQTESSFKKIVISSVDAPAAIGPYSQAILVGNTLYCSGQIAFDVKTGELIQDNIEAETKQVLSNLGAVLKAAEMDYDDVVKATVFLQDLTDYNAVNSVYAEFFGDKPPAREAVEVARLPRDANVEISLIAVKNIN